MKIYAFDPHKGKDVLAGDIIENDFTRTVEQKHFMRVVQGYGIQESCFEQLLGHKVSRVILIEKETGHAYTSRITDWVLHGKVADYGHGKQRFLSLRFMEKQ